MNSGCEGNCLTFIEGDEARPVRSEKPIAAAAAGFVALLAFSVLWPLPILWLNDATVDAPLTIDSRSFLGRESPAADVLFWAIAGIYTLTLLHGRLDTIVEQWTLLVADVRTFGWRIQSRVRCTRAAHAVIALVASIVAVAAAWWFVDAPLIALAETWQTDATRAATRMFNRLGGGMNPAMIVVFFILVGLVFATRRWWRLGCAMCAAALSGGILVQLLKALVGRSRPELWLGAFHFANPKASSFPSGHTIGAFAIASSIVFGSRSLPLRIIAIVLACGVGAARVMAFRHWPSDVVASAILGIWLGWFFSTAIAEES